VKSIKEVKISLKFFTFLFCIKEKNKPITKGNHNLIILLITEYPTIKFVFEKGAQIKFEANLKEKFDNVSVP
jgi:hypothetical protein